MQHEQTNIEQKAEVRTNPGTFHRTTWQRTAATQTVIPKLDSTSSHAPDRSSTSARATSRSESNNCSTFSQDRPEACLRKQRIKIRSPQKPVLPTKASQNMLRRRSTPSTRASATPSTNPCRNGRTPQSKCPTHSEREADQCPAGRFPAVTTRAGERDREAARSPRGRCWPPLAIPDRAPRCQGFRYMCNADNIHEPRKHTQMNAQDRHRHVQI